MAKEPHKDPFENLPKPRLFALIASDPGEVGAVRMPEKIEKAKAAIAAVKSKRGPKKGTGGRPKKDGAVAKRTEQHRRKKDNRGE